ncbi:MAG: hypothetical protein JJU46_10455 [Balneolaceae bacterium]|nr:hypothetical protein [Balneolaceae bacterium]MCH8549470.1 hypothetical protein [Balneolaceae bacterium]
MKIKRTLYLGYYLKQLDRKKFRSFVAYASEKTGRSASGLMSDALQSVYRYNISPMEYFQFRFYEKNRDERELWAGTGFMYEYQLGMNPKEHRDILDDKRLFYKNYGEFFVHNVADDADLADPERAEAVLNNPSGKIVLKVSDGKCGSDVEIRNSADFDPESLRAYMKSKNYGLAEEFIRQHPEIDRMSPSAVNTIRIFTQLNSRNEVELLGCRFRISVNSPVDNMAAGNLAAPVDEKTGVVNGPGVYSDITKPDCEKHPVTGVEIPGFQIPFWKETINMVKEAASKHPQNRSIGWDVVITENGPGLIEGNHDWCKLLWQLPAQKGLKSTLERYEVPANPDEKRSVKEPVLMT